MSAPMHNTTIGDMRMRRDDLMALMDRLPPPVRLRVDLLAVQVNPLPLLEALAKGASVPFLLRRLEEIERHLVGRAALIDYGPDHPQAAEAI